MAKQKRERCEHGNSPVYMTGCAYCATLAMKGFYMLRDFKCGPVELLVLLRKHYTTDEAFQADLAEARKTVEEAQRDPAPTQGTH